MKLRTLTLMSALFLAVVLLLPSSSALAHEADGQTRKQGPIRFTLQADGTLHIMWNNWVEGGGDSPPIARWEVVLFHDQAGLTKNVMGAEPRRVTFRGLEFGERYRVNVRAMEKEEGGSRIDQRTLNVTVEHVSPPVPVKKLKAKVRDDGQSVTASWSATKSGGKHKRYNVMVTDTETGKTKVKRILTKQDGNGVKSLKTKTVFKRLSAGATYRLSVQALNRNTRWQKGDATNDKWQKSEWVSTEVTLPEGESAPAGNGPTLKWEFIKAGDANPPNAVGEPTTYIIYNDDTGAYEWFDAPKICPDYTDPMLMKKAKVERAKAQTIAGDLEEAKAKLAAAQAERQEYLDNTPEEDRDPGKVNYHDAMVKVAEDEVEAVEQELAEAEATLKAKCLVAYPEDENLTEEDDRWVQVPTTVEDEGAEE